MAFTFDAEIRKDLGKGASRRQRREDKVPAVVYGGNKEAVSISLDHKKIFIAQQSDSFYNENITLNIAGNAEQVKVVAIQRHPVKQQIVHLDFLRQ
jgi:large subunit ribosomal protein L25